MVYQTGPSILQQKDIIARHRGLKHTNWRWRQRTMGRKLEKMAGGRRNRWLVCDSVMGSFKWWPCHLVFFSSQALKWRLWTAEELTRVNNSCLSLDVLFFQSEHSSKVTCNVQHVCSVWNICLEWLLWSVFLVWSVFFPPSNNIFFLLENWTSMIHCQAKLHRTYHELTNCEAVAGRRHKDYSSVLLLYVVVSIEKKLCVPVRKICWAI